MAARRPAFMVNRLTMQPTGVDIMAIEATNKYRYSLFSTRYTITYEDRIKKFRIDVKCSIYKYEVKKK